MTEDDGPGTADTTVDSVTGLLASRLGAVGESAGEVMRRDVRTAAGGAESVALLAQADFDGARTLSAQLPGMPGPIAGSVEVGPVPERSAEPPQNPPDRLPVGADESAGDEEAETPIPAQPVASATEPAGVPAAEEAPARPGSAREPEAGQPGPGPTGIPDSERAGTTQAETGGGHPAPEKTAPSAAEAAPAADSAQTVGRSATSDTVPPTVGPGQTPWTPDDSGSGTGPGRDQTPGATPWNNGANALPPHMPGLPGGLPGSPTPQERPPRGNPPWSRGRGGGTVFPRPRPDERPSGRMH